MRARIWMLAAISFVVGCARATVVNDVDEKQANEIVVLLHDEGIAARKVRNDRAREVVYSVTVPSRDEVRAMKVAGAHEYPRATANGYEAPMAEDGSIIPTAQEESLRKLAAVEGEIEKRVA